MCCDVCTPEERPATGGSLPSCVVLLLWLLPAHTAVLSSYSVAASPCREARVMDTIAQHLSSLSHKVSVPRR